MSYEEPIFVTSQIFATTNREQGQIFDLTEQKLIFAGTEMDDSYNLPNKHTVQGALLVLFGCCKLSHMTFPKLRKKELFVKLSKFTK